MLAFHLGSIFGQIWYWVDEKISPPWVEKNGLMTYHIPVNHTFCRVSMYLGIQYNKFGALLAPTLLIFSGQERMEEVVAEHLTDRYRSAHSSPFAPGCLLDDIGHFGQDPEVRDILEGT